MDLLEILNWKILCRRAKARYINFTEYTYKISISSFLLNFLSLQRIICTKAAFLFIHRNIKNRRS